jgi:hypothetical protein
VLRLVEILSLKICGLKVKNIWPSLYQMVSSYHSFKLKVPNIDAPCFHPADEWNNLVQSESAQVALHHQSPVPIPTQRVVKSSNQSSRWYKFWRTPFVWQNYLTTAMTSLVGPTAHMIVPWTVIRECTRRTINIVTVEASDWYHTRW